MSSALASWLTLIPVSPTSTFRPFSARKPFGGMPPGVGMASAIISLRVGAKPPRESPVSPAIVRWCDPGTVRTVRWQHSSSSLVGLPQSDFRCGEKSPRCRKSSCASADADKPARRTVQTRDRVGSSQGAAPPPAPPGRAG
jgi:hypothetical protein